MARSIKQHTGLIICLGLIAAVFAVYGQTGSFGFIDYDDPAYVSGNPHVQQGLTRQSVVWALSATYAGTWQPLTWLSFMLGCELHGLDAGRHHLTNVLLHALNAVLLFCVLRTLTGALWRSALVAALFAVHPLHVESVAWITERKDVLSMLFWLLTIFCYAGYCRRRGPARYLSALLCFALGLMAKPMLVTLPLVLLLIDWWPLGRLRAAPRRCLLEKVPFVLLAAGSCAITWYAQQAAGAIGSSEVYPLAVRVGNALIAYIAYIKKMLWPAGLAAPYLHPGTVALLPAAACAALMALMTAAALRSARSRPYLLWGWCFYVITLLPVIGLVQIGLHRMADRFSYIPLTGLYVFAVWGGSECAQRFRAGKQVAGAGACIALTVLTLLSWRQTGYWKDALSLFGHTLEVEPANYVARGNHAYALYMAGRAAEALSDFEKALQQQPDDVELLHNYGLALSSLGRFQDAVEIFLHALKINPTHAHVHNSLGNAFENLGRPLLAVSHFDHAVSSDPEFAEAQFNLGRMAAKFNRFEKAIACYQAAIRINPGYAQAHNNLGLLLFQSGKPRAALEHFRDAVRIDPGYAIARANLAKVQAALDIPGESK